MLTGMTTQGMVTAAEAARLLKVNLRSIPDLVKLRVLPEAHKMPGLRGARLFAIADVYALAKSAGLVETEDERTPETHGEPLLGVPASCPTWSPAAYVPTPGLPLVDKWSDDPDRTTRRGEL